MTDPLRLLEGDDSVTADERRALASELGRASPPGAKHAVWGALAVKLAAASTAAAATGATATGAAAGGVGTTAASTLTVLSLVKFGGIGLALGVTVSTAAFVAERRAAPPAPVELGAAPDVPERAASDDVARQLGAPPATETPPPAAELPPAAPSAERVLREKTFESAAPPAVVETEMQRVARARAELRSGNAPGALRTLRALELDEPSGLLTQEREALLIEALATSGEQEAARRRAAAFLTRYPRSPHAAAVRRATE